MTVPFRTTERWLCAATPTGLQGDLNRLGTLRRQLSSGKMISRPSDSPTGTASAMRLRGDIRRLRQYARNAEDGKGWLATVDRALSSGVGMVHRVRDLVLQGMFPRTADPGARAALATEVDSLRESLLGLANASYLDRPVFGGTTASPRAYDQNGSYLGDSGAVLRTVSGRARIRVDTAGPAAFGTGPVQLFTVLSAISADLRGNPGNLSADLARLETSMQAMQGQLAEVGGRYDRIARSGRAAADHLTDLQSALSEVEDVDLAKTITELRLQQTAYQTALGATAQVAQPSLIDFLR